MRKRYQKIHKREKTQHESHAFEKKSKDQYADEQRYFHEPAHDPENNPYQYPPEHIEELKRQARAERAEKSKTLKNFVNVVGLVLLLGFLVSGKSGDIIEWGGEALFALVIIGVTIVPIVFALFKLTKYFSLETAGRIGGFLLVLLGFGIWVLLGQILGG
ncbi:MAG: DUF308 domain-containing protein [Alphaproteobacteria bacterium]|nr:DUF308 domain-containing protein [Alphaproteobacteria bacterium]